MALEVQLKKKPKGPIKFQIQLNEEQKAVKSAILNNVITIVTGQAGSGKTLVACQAALDSLFTKEVEKIINQDCKVAPEVIDIHNSAAKNRKMEPSK